MGGFVIFKAIELDQQFFVFVLLCFSTIQLPGYGSSF